MCCRPTPSRIHRLPLTPPPRCAISNPAFRDKTTRPLLQRIIERNELAEGYAIGKFQLDFSPEAQAKLKKAEAAAAAAAAGGGRQRADSPTALEDRVDEVLEECGVSYVHDHTKVLDNTAAERALDAHLAQAADSDKRIFDLDSNITCVEQRCRWASCSIGGPTSCFVFIAGCLRRRWSATSMSRWKTTS